MEDRNPRVGSSILSLATINLFAAEESLRRAPPVGPSMRKRTQNTCQGWHSSKLAIMKIATSLALAASLLIAAVPTVNASSNTRDAAAGQTQLLIKLENAWVEAIAQHNVSALDRILADDFIDTSWTGALRDKQRMLARARSRHGGSGAQRLQDVGVRFYHGAAIVTGTNVVTNKRFGEVRIRFTDVFIMRDHRWQAVSAQETVVRASSARRK